MREQQLKLAEKQRIRDELALQVAEKQARKNAEKQLLEEQVLFNLFSL